MPGNESRMMFGKNLITNVPDPVQIVDQSVLTRARSVEVSPSDVDMPLADTFARVIYAAVAGRSHVISGIAWSYSAGAPTNGNLEIMDGVDIVFMTEIAAVGPDSITFNPPKRGRAGRAMTITLSAGGGAVIGLVSIMGHWME